MTPRRRPDRRQGDSLLDAPIAEALDLHGTSAFAGSPLRRRATLWISGTARNLGTLGGNNSYGRGLLVGTWPDPGESSIYVIGESEIVPGSFFDAWSTTSASCATSARSPAAP